LEDKLGTVNEYIRSWFQINPVGKIAEKAVCRSVTVVE